MLERLSTLLLLLALSVAPAAATAEEAEDTTGGTTGGFVLDLPVFDWGGQEPGDPETGQPFCCQETHFGLAAAEVVALQAIPWFFNRHVADDETAVVGIKTWLRNLREGFEWDNNDFKTNMFMHPFHGSVYFNAARSNGYDFWEATAFAWAGSFMWEMFGENNRGAINDWVATSMGGMALGEALHRTAISIRDNGATGLERGAREFSSFLIDPVGGFNRLIRGEGSRLGPNPEGRHPAHTTTVMRVGARTLNSGKADASLSGGFFEMDFYYGDPYGEHEDPFDSFEMRIAVNGSDTQRLGLIQIDGVLFGRSSESEKGRKMFSVNQLYDYVNNAVFELGGQSLALTWRWDRKVSKTWWLRAQVQPTVAILWAVQSDITEEAEDRSYDFGSGGGTRARFYLTKNGRDWLEIRYLINWSATLSGAAGSHLVQFVSARTQVPIFRSLGIGADWVLASRNSHYRDHPNVSINDSQVRIFLTIF